MFALLANEFVHQLAKSNGEFCHQALQDRR